MKRIVCLILLCSGLVSAMAQDVYYSSGHKNGYHKKTTAKGYDPDKLILGGGINFGLANDYANFGISPRIGYKFNNYIAAGVGIGYQFYKSPYDAYNYPGVDVRDNIIFPGLWLKCKIWGPLYAAVDLEYDFISENGYTPAFDSSVGTFNGIEKAKFNVGVPCMLMGVGYKYHLGGRVSASVELMYDVLQQEYSPYYQQIVYRAGIYVGL